MTLSLLEFGESVKISVWLLVTVCLQKTLLRFGSAHMCVLMHVCVCSYHACVCVCVCVCVCGVFTGQI